MCYTFIPLAVQVCLYSHQQTDEYTLHYDGVMSQGNKNFSFIIIFMGILLHMQSIFGRNVHMWCMTVYFTDNGAKSFYVFRVMKEHTIAGNRLCLAVEGDKDRDRKD